MLSKLTVDRSVGSVSESQRNSIFRLASSVQVSKSMPYNGPLGSLRISRISDGLAVVYRETSLVTREEGEIVKYLGIYSDKLYKGYGHSNHGKTSTTLWDTWDVSSVVDVGCGHNEFILGLKEWPRKWKLLTGVDFACPSADLIAKATNLPFEDKRFDLLTSFDCLEHLLPDQVDAALAEMARVSHAFVFSISYVPSKITWQGQNLHPTVRSKEWWIDTIQKSAALVNQSGRFLYGLWGDKNVMEKPAPGTKGTIVLVGNGPSVMNGGNGAKIDSFDEIVRFNAFKIKGYEEYSGARTTLWGTFGHGIVPQDDTRPERMIIRGSAIAAYPAAETWRIPIEEFQLWQKTLQAITDIGPEKVMPSSGFLLLNWLLDSGVPVVHLAGFDHFSKKKSAQHHYWIPKPFKAPQEHNGLAEERIVADLVKAGRVVYL